MHYAYRQRNNVTKCQSVVLSLFLSLIERVVHTRRDSPGGSMWRGQCTFGPTRGRTDILASFRTYATTMIYKDKRGWFGFEACHFSTLIPNWPSIIFSLPIVGRETHTLYTRRCRRWNEWRCRLQNEGDRDSLHTVEYYPDKGFAFKYYPYYNQPNYMPPVVFVQFNTPQESTLIQV